MAPMSVLEPGGQFELSGAPLATMQEMAAEFDSHLAEVRPMADPMGVGFLGIGAAPIWTHDQMPVMPKGRYRLMTDYMGRVGTHGTQMMYRTCTVQVNLDYASEADMVQKLRVALALQPVATALFAIQPVFRGQAERAQKLALAHLARILMTAAPACCPLPLTTGWAFRPMSTGCWMCRCISSIATVDTSTRWARSFRDFLKGELPALPGEKPTLSDWADHMTTVFPEARVKKYIEMRGADAGDRAHMMALPAFWVGLMYDQGALDAAWDLVKGLDAPTREGLRVAATVSALQG